MIQEVLEKMCTPDREEQCFATRRPRQVEFNTSSRLKHDVESELFHTAVRTGFCWTVLRSSNCFLANCFQEEIPNVVLLQVVHLPISFLSTDKLARPFFLSLSGRIVDTNSPLLRKYWAGLQNEMFGTRVLCLENLHWSVWYIYPSSSLGFRDSKYWCFWTQGDRFLWIAVPFCGLWHPILLSERKKISHTTSLPTQDLENVQCPCENFIAYSVTFSAFEKEFSSFYRFDQSMSLNIDMKRIQSSNTSCK